MDDGQGGTKWDILPERIFTCIHWYIMWSNCPRPAPLTTNNPFRGTDGRDMGHGTKRDIFYMSA